MSSTRRQLTPPERQRGAGLKVAPEPEDFAPGMSGQGTERNAANKAPFSRGGAIHSGENHGAVLHVAFDDEEPAAIGDPGQRLKLINRDSNRQQ